MGNLDNANPTVFQCSKEREVLPEEEDDQITDKFDSREVFDLIREINDPEHPLTLEELNVVQESQVVVKDEANSVHILFTPTIPHCSMATLIGLSIRVKLLRSLPARFKVDVQITPGTHDSELAVNKQLADKERVAAALENSHLLEVLSPLSDLALAISKRRIRPSARGFLSETVHRKNFLWKVRHSADISNVRSQSKHADSRLPGLALIMPTSSNNNPTISEHISKSEHRSVQQPALFNLKRGNKTSKVVSNCPHMLLKMSSTVDDETSSTDNLNRPCTLSPEALSVYQINS